MTTRPVTIQENGRGKAYRPLPEAARRAAFDAGLEAYDRGDAFLAHEHLEPAWMGASDPAERALHAGLIKTAAAFVHLARGNPAGVAKNLAGAELRLANAGAAGPAWGIDVPALLGLIRTAHARLDRGEPVQPIPIPRLEVRVP
ncbi:MAG: DUF309 domain-containing protein [Chloroflexi bacterium]|nr:DUF309 domain-containing protein [Chloroflexota bacterium]